MPYIVAVKSGLVSNQHKMGNRSRILHPNWLSNCHATTFSNFDESPVVLVFYKWILPQAYLLQSRSFSIKNDLFAARHTDDQIMYAEGNSVSM
jgi:hypothetical protein